MRLMSGKLKFTSDSFAAVVKFIVPMQLFFAAALLFSGCSDKENNPVSGPVVEEAKNGTISTDEDWSDIAKVYRIDSDCSIEASVTWGEGITVIVDSGTVINICNNGILTVEENVKVRLHKGAYVNTGDASRGSLIVNGSETGPVTFKADTGSKAWGLESGDRSGGIILGDSAINVSLKYCNISGAEAGIYVRTGSPLINNCRISSCVGNGIYFDTTAGPGDSSTFNDISIKGCGGFPITLPAGKLGNFAGEVEFSDLSDDKSAIRVFGTSIHDSSAIWRKKSLPYVFSGTTLVSSYKCVSSVRIMPGVICKFEKGACIDIGDPRFGAGELKAIGNESDSIFFVNSSADDVWGDSTGGIIVGMESPINTAFEYCSIQKATTGIFVNPGAKVTVKHCLINGCASNGITFYGGSPFDSLSFRDNSFVNNSGYGISIPADKLVNLGGSCNVDNNEKGGIYVSAAEVWLSGIWKKFNSPYIVDGIVDIGYQGGVEISIAEGAEFYFLPGSFIRVGNRNAGTLIAGGSEELPILFTSFIQDEFWGADSGDLKGAGIMIEQNADEKTELNHCKIQKATNGAYVNAPVKIQNCSISDCKYYGLIRDTNSNDELISDNSFADNGTDSEIVISQTDTEIVE